MEKIIEKVKVDVATFKNLKKMLLSTEEDFELAVATIKSLEISSIMITILAKSLMYGKRQIFMENFGTSVGLIIGSNKRKEELSSNSFTIDLSWENLFPLLAKSPYLTELDKTIVELELSNTVLQTLRGIDYKFIKKLNLDLKW
tara:strand:+ start:423 stop:854 length:432 start_codon:yes stop_codon:yes gene_type:complete